MRQLVNRKIGAKKICWHSFSSELTEMAKKKRSIDDLSIAEIEQLLARKKREVHDNRLARFRKSGRALLLVPQLLTDNDENGKPDVDSPSGRGIFRKPILRWVFNRLLLWVEIAAVLGVMFVFFRGFGLLQDLNKEVAEAMDIPAGTATPLITAVVLPSGHYPPTSAEGARPNDDEIPANLRPLVQTLPSLPIPTPGPEQPQQIFIENLWSSAQPIVQGDGWEQLKKGVGQHIGSGSPGQNDNLVLSAHNDIFGELFRYLDRLRPGDEIKIATKTMEFTYIVTGFRIVEPTEVSVLESSEKSTITLISCYPYLVDTQRIVVFGELKEG